MTEHILCPICGEHTDDVNPCCPGANSRMADIANEAITMAEKYSAQVDLLECVISVLVTIIIALVLWR